jgi:hypothetical protein
VPNINNLRDKNVIYCDGHFYQFQQHRDENAREPSAKLLPIPLGDRSVEGAKARYMDLALLKAAIKMGEASIVSHDDRLDTQPKQECGPSGSSTPMIVGPLFPRHPHAKGLIERCLMDFMKSKNAPSRNGPLTAWGSSANGCA